MKMTYIIIVGLIITGGLIYFLSRRKNSETVDNQSTNEKVDPENNPYNDLRGQVFSATPEQIGLTNTDDERPYAIVMDMGMEEGTATLVSIIDGNASMYLSSGGGVIGGFGHENCKKAAIDFVNMGQDYFTKMVSVDSFPLPKADNVRFYILTNKGKYSIEEAIEKIENDKSDWGQLFFEGQKVITELRLIAEWK
jgi:hypothetical protein